MKINLSWCIIEAPTLEFLERRIMDNTTIKIKVHNRVAFCDGNSQITTMNTGDKVVFEFDDEWNPESFTETRTARFIKGNDYIDIPFNGNVCVLPAYSDYGNVYIGVFWGDIKTTNPAKITVNTSIASEFGFPENPPNEVYNQILEVLNQKVNQAQLEQAVEKALTETHLIEECDCFLKLKPETTRYHLMSGAAVSISCYDFSQFPLGYLASITFYNPYAPSILESFKIEAEILRDYSDNGLPLSELKIGLGTKGTILFIYKTDHGNKFRWFLSTADKQLNKEHIDDSVKAYFAENPVYDGYTPQREIDYWTLEDKEEIQEDNMAFITEELAKRGQLKPEFANSIDDCVDETKLYVLPDGYIYSCIYSSEETQKEYINHLTEAGYQDGYLSSSNGNVSSKAGYSTTGFIQIGVGTNDTSNGEQVIYLKGINASKTDGYVRIAFYDENKTYITYQSANSFVLDNSGKAGSVRYELGDDGYISLLDLGNFTYYIKTNMGKTPAYFRLCAPTMNSDSYINVNGEYNEVIVDGGGYEWKNTGHAFVPSDYADYESRIYSLEKQTNEILEKVESGIASDDIPDYVKTEAESVANKVIENRNADSLILLMASDIHVIAGDHEIYNKNKVAIKHLGMGMAEIRRQTRPDGVILLGDYVYNVTPLDKNQAKNAIKEVIKSLYDATNGVSSVWLDGNHDYYETSGEYRLTDGEHYALVGANNSQETEIDSDNLVRNYGYIDFKKQKIRLIYLNTTDISGNVASPNYITNTQGQWLINTALNMKGKADEDKWGIVVCSHFPIYSQQISTGIVIFPDLKKVLCDYKDKRGGAAFGTTYDFGSASSELIATFHGHIHNFKVTDVVTDKGNIVKSICIPNGCPDRENPYGDIFQDVDESGNPISYPKTENTAEDTSFNAVVVDKQSRKIHCFNYGAGVDRVVEF